MIPVMRNTKLPLILVQLTNLSMLLESTVWAVCRLAVPMPSHAGAHDTTTQHVRLPSKDGRTKMCNMWFDLQDIKDAFKANL